MTLIDRAPGGERIRIGVAGLGAVAQAVHLPLLARLNATFEIAALADLSPSLRATIGDRYGVATDARVASVEALIGRPGLDGIVLLTSGSHGGVALAALDAGLAVLCEKPLATTVAEADRLAASSNSGRLLLGYMKAFDPAVEEARRLVVEQAATLGDLRSIDVHVLHPTGDAQLAFAHLVPPAGDVDPAVLATLRAASDELVVAALGSDAAGGDLGRLYDGILLASIVHELSVIRSVTGDADPLSIDHVEVWPDRVWPPSVAILGRLSTGVRVSIGWHFLERYPAYREEVRLHFEGGSVELTFPSPYRLNQPTLLTVETGIDAPAGRAVRSGAAGSSMAERGTTAGGPPATTPSPAVSGGIQAVTGETRRRTAFESIDEAFERELLAFARLIRDGEAPRTGIADGRTDTITCQRIAAALAARRGLAIGGEAAAAGA